MRYTLQTWDGACLIDGLALTREQACEWANRAGERLPHRRRPRIKVWSDPLAPERITYLVAVLD
jgi:hypothetical protein